MANKKRDPHKTHEFWASEEWIPKRKSYSDFYLARCQAIIDEAKQLLSRHKKQDGLHLSKMQRGV